MAHLPKDENGAEIVKGDLVLLEDRLYKVVGWKKPKEDEPHQLELVNTKDRQVVGCDAVLCLGSDEIRGLSRYDLRPKIQRTKFKKGDWVKNLVSGSVGRVLSRSGVGDLQVERWSRGRSEVTYWVEENCDETKPPADYGKNGNGKSKPRRFYLGDKVYHTKYKEIGKVIGTFWGGDNESLQEREIRIETAKSTGVVVEDWDGADCIISAVSGVSQVPPSQGDLNLIFGGGGFSNPDSGWDAGWSGFRGYASRSRPSRKPQKKDNISTADLISQEARRLQNEERRDKIMGKEPKKSEEAPKPKIKTRKGSW